MWDCQAGWGLHATGVLRFVSIPVVRVALSGLRHVCPLTDGYISYDTAVAIMMLLLCTQRVMVFCRNSSNVFMEHVPGETSDTRVHETTETAESHYCRGEPSVD